MKVAFLVGAFPAISETFILNQITGLIDLGHEVDIYARTGSPNEKVHQEIRDYQLLNRTYYFSVPKQRRVRMLRIAMLLIRNFHKNPGTIIRSFIVAKRFKVGRLAASNYVLHFLGKHYDIIHCHFGPNGFIGVLLKEMGFADKVVVSFHGQDVSSYVKQQGYSVYDRVFEGADVITANSRHTMQRLIYCGCCKEKIIVLRMGVNLGKFSFKTRSFDANDIVRILTVARLIEKKGLEYSVKAVASILPKYPRLIYLIVGDGPLREEIKALISTSHAENGIKLLGWCERGEVQRLFDECHLFILSSVTAYSGDQEGQGLVLQEAQAMGLPVLSTHHNGIPEGVMDGESGFLVPERDVEALAERLEFLINHPEIWPEMGRAGRRFVEEHYDMRKLNHRLVSLYEHILAGGIPVEFEERPLVPATLR